MSPVLWQAIGYACGISLGILALAILVQGFARRLDRQATESDAKLTDAKLTETQSASEAYNTPEGSQSA